MTSDEFRVWLEEKLAELEAMDDIPAVEEGG